MRHFGGFVLAVIGAYLMLWVKKRQFKRGQQVKAFNSFPEKVVANSIERAASGIAIFCIVIGCLLFLL